MPTVYETRLPEVRLVARGKVRDIYDLGQRLLLVASDRLSAFDYVLPTPIPDKGKVLTQISVFWFERFSDLVANHMVTTDVAEFPSPLPAYAAQLEGRSMLVEKLEMLPVECVARGYLAGSGWTEYRERGTVCGIKLPAGLEESAPLPEPIFTPATKAQSGHDENIPYGEVERLIGEERAAEVRKLTLDLYRAGSEYARQQGILIADTKFEFGVAHDRLVLADEALTPDSSRFWPVAGYRPGGSQPSFDKQYVRDHLLSIGWNKQPPVPR
ncbi:MAG TPA: phosphoribosylaminoimidazolesuccinocarboxamide synthase, partial [Candidatus Polarisedimenticolaceae bacterium]|nr:phosphoribosylaminoimidazolesuccinocarboxamide synthase [Candidatus Polarisedimenticolaceae bacterium]